MKESLQATKRALVAAASVIIFVGVKHVLYYENDNTQSINGSNILRIPKSGQYVTRNMEQVKYSRSLTPEGSSSSPAAKYPDFSFFVMGDIPYSHEEEETLAKQLQEISSMAHTGQDNSLFIAHVGDLMTASHTKCKESQFQKVASIFRDNSALPIMAVPGNNEFVSCPHADEALGNFRKYIIPLDHHRAQANNDSVVRLQSEIVRPDDHEEYFAFIQSDVLFLGLNMMPKPRFRQVEEDAKKWLNEQLDLHLDHVRAVIVFGHSANGKPVVFHEVNRRIRKADIPLVMFNGDKHKYAFHENFGYVEIRDWRKLWRVTVDQGAIAPPIKVTVLGNKIFPEDGLLEEEFGFAPIIDGFIKLDRQGGRYDDVSESDKER